MGKKRTTPGHGTNKNDQDIQKSPVHILVSTQHNRTFLMTSEAIKTFVIFENPVKEVDRYGNTLVYYSSITVRNM